MSSIITNPRWKEKVDVTYEDYFNPLWYIPHIGIVQIARELKAEVGKEKACSTISRAVGRLAYDWTRKVTAGVSVDSLGDLEKGLAPIHDLPDFVIGSGSGGCLWAKSFREMGAEDIGYIWCCLADNALTEALSPHLKLYSTKTLMMGDDHCNYCWKWEE